MPTQLTPDLRCQFVVDGGSRSGVVIRSLVNSHVVHDRLRNEYWMVPDKEAVLTPMDAKRDEEGRVL